jgi:hypothetical protein
MALLPPRRPGRLLGETPTPEQREARIAALEARLAADQRALALAPRDRPSVRAERRTLRATVRLDFVFASSSGRPLAVRNIVRRGLEVLLAEPM